MRWPKVLSGKKCRLKCGHEGWGGHVARKLILSVSVNTDPMQSLLYIYIFCSVHRKASK